MTPLLLALLVGLPAGRAEWGTANWHNFELLGPTELIPSAPREDGAAAVVCTDPATNQTIEAMACPAGRQCFAAQYSPTGFGCTTAGSQNGCCLLGAAHAPDASLPNCLVMGDSVSIGYEAKVAEQLAGICNVQHSPWDVSNGGWGQSQTARACLDVMLLDAKAEPVQYDVIFFNNGLHNLEDNSTAAVQQYADDMTSITQTLLATGAKVRYGLTTPQMTFYNNGSRIVESLNAAAAAVMLQHHVPVTDLYSRVVEICGGAVPYTYCPLCSNYPDPCAFHYKTEGYSEIAMNVSAAIRLALEEVR